MTYREEATGRDRSANEEIGDDGVYLDDCQTKWPSKWAMDKEQAERLWRLSEELVGERVGSGSGKGKGSRL